MCSTVILLLLVSLMAVEVTGLLYSELSTLDPSCIPMVTCSTHNRNNSKNEIEWKDRNCGCDPLCSKYGDCCIDSIFLKPQEANESFQNYQCVSMREYGNLYMKGTCMSGWEDQRIEEMCNLASPSHSSHREDPMRDMPVTNKESKITYMNRFCAICNNDSTSLEFWKPHIECSKEMQNYNSKFGNITLKYVYNNLFQENGTWGIYLESAFNGKSEFSSCTIDPQMPANVKKYTRKCKCITDPSVEKQCNHPISTCREEWHDADVEKLCQSYTAIVYQDHVSYRNSHCAQCNNVATDTLQCNVYEGRTIFAPDIFNSQAFSLLFDFLDFNGNNIVGSVCNIDEIWDPFFKQCRNIVCGKKNYEYKLSKCVPISDINTTISTESPSTPTTTVTPADTKTTTGVIRNVGIIFPGEPGLSTGPWEVPNNTAVRENSNKSITQNIECDRILLSKEEFKRDVNGTVYVGIYDRNFNMSEYVIHNDGILICINNFTMGVEKFSPIMGYVTLLGLGLSCIGILIHLVAFFIIPGLRNLSEKNLASLCFSLLGAYVSFVLGLFGDAESNECFILAVVMYYFFLSSFFWMNIMAFDIRLTLQRATSKGKVHQGGRWSRFLFYSIYGWFMPFAASGIVVLIDITQPEGIPTEMMPALGQRLCWFGHRNALVVFFAAPLGLLMGINIVLFILSANRSLQSTDRGQFMLLIRLTLLMGLTWISGIIAGYMQTEPVWYIFIILNSLQGLFIFLAFTDLKKLWSVVIGGGLCFRKQFLPRQVSVLNTRTPSTSTQNLELSENTSMVNI